MAEGKGEDKTPPPSPGKRGPRFGDGAGGSGGGEVRVVRDGGGAANWPMLTKSNYTEWALLMKIKMKARNLWEAIDPGYVTTQEDMLALDAITSAVPQDMVASLAVKETALDAWNAVKLMRVGSNAVQKTKVQRLRKEFEDIRFKEGEAVDDFVIRLSNLVAGLSTIGKVVEESKAVEKLLRVVPKRLSTVAVAIEVTADLATLTLEDVGGRLHAAEERATEDEDPPPVRSDEKLYLTEEQWMSRWKQRDHGNGHGGSGNVGGAHGKRRPRGRRSNGTGKKDGASGPSSGGGRNVGPDQCRCCGKNGHWARECPTKPKRAEAHVAQGEEEEGPSLFFASAAVNVDPPPPPTGSIHLVEERVYAQLDGEGGADAGLWYLDTGATNHMTGAHDVFTELDTSVQGTVRFEDGSVVRIEGRGSILFEAKSGEHQRLAEVYYIPRLTANIVSLGQLDEAECCASGIAAGGSWRAFSIPQRTCTS
ncbi:unnamed protein product [Urochloa humidicola]